VSGRRANVTDGQRALARTLLDADDWVSTATLLEATGIGNAALSLALTRRVTWGWVERRTLPRPGGPAEWRTTAEGRIRLRDVLIADERPEPTGPSTAEIRTWALSLGLPVASHGAIRRAIYERWNREHPDRRVALPAVSWNWGSPEYARRGGLATSGRAEA
jgi:hypothetical protein